VRRLVVLATIALALAACSPEARRARAGGPGGDVGNRGDVLKMHEGSQPYWRTPHVAGIRGPAIDEANHADRLSR
jgi:hypothetical protein